MIVGGMRGIAVRTLPRNARGGRAFGLADVAAGPRARSSRMALQGGTAGRRCASSGGGGGSSGGGSSSGGAVELSEGFWQWTAQARPHWRECRTEAAVAIGVFGVTGSLSVAAVRPMLKHTIGLEGSWRDGPWSYRVGSVLLVSPVYASVLVALGTAAGRHAFFAGMGTKILGRFLPRAAGEKLTAGLAAAVRARIAREVAAKKKTRS